MLSNALLNDAGALRDVGFNSKTFHETTTPKIDPDHHNRGRQDPKTSYYCGSPVKAFIDQFNTLCANQTWVKWYNDHTQFS